MPETLPAAGNLQVLGFPRLRALVPREEDRRGTCSTYDLARDGGNQDPYGGRGIGARAKLAIGMAVLRSILKLMRMCVQRPTGKRCMFLYALTSSSTVWHGRS
jgi:hypothetical protein